LGYAAVAAKLARQVLQQDPNSLDALGVFAQAAPVSGDRSAVQEAGTLLDAAVRRHPAEERSLMLQTRFWVASGQPQAALPGLEAYCQGKEGSGSIAARVTLADLYRLAGDTARADTLIKQLEQSDPDKQIVVHARFLWLASQKRWEDLQQVSSSYIKAKDQDLAAIMKAASTLMSSGRPELKGEGLKLLEHAASTWPTSVEARLNLASTLYAGGDAERAEKLCREVLAQYPNEVQALNNLAWIMQERYQRHDAALELANKGLKLAPDDTDLLDTRGTILAKLPDRLADAKSDFARLADLLPASSPERAKALLQLGRICGKLRDSAQTRQRVQEALEIDQKVNVFTAAERSEIAEIMKQASR
jgi:tetratricopeptide (TPR) repeat protein